LLGPYEEAGEFFRIENGVSADSIAFRAWASLVSRIARICPEPANGLPNSLALFWTANLGRFSTTEARTGDTPRSTSAQRSSSRSAIQLRQVRRAISATLENSVVDRRYDRFLLR
jgi:hypothetical protein